MQSLAEARKGIKIQEGLETAEKKFKLDRNKADLDKDDKLSKYEEAIGEAVQKAMDDHEITEMSHGGIAGVCGMMSDPMPNLMPVGASENEVADDISIIISEGEYVLPANVLKWHGLKAIMDMQSETEMGLMMMHDIGLIQEVDRETESGS